MPTLLILAAGMGSRYGGLKQLDSLGPSGETIMDYSVYDAIDAGFDKLVFVIRESFESQFKQMFNPQRFGNRIQVEYVFQDLNDLPSPFSLPDGRTKPWGAGHAVLCAQQCIQEPFAVLNADDYYGKTAFRKMADYLKKSAGQAKHYAMIGFRLSNTLSEAGGVTRAICEYDAHSRLSKVIETYNLQILDGEIINFDEQNQLVRYKSNALVSMNFWGFKPDFFDKAEALFKQFLNENGTNPSAEIHIPFLVNAMLAKRYAQIDVLETTDQWFGVTFPEDRETVRLKFRALVQAGVYPEKLWD